MCSQKSSKAGQATTLTGDLYGNDTARVSGTSAQPYDSIANRSAISPRAIRSTKPLLLRIKELSAARVRYGQRRIHVLLRREGWAVNHKRVARLYRREGLSLRAKAPKRRRSCTARSVRLAPTQPNHVWSMDFMHDRLMDDSRRPFRLLTVVDIFTRECLALEVATGFRARSVVEILARIVSARGTPNAIRCDQGTEFTAEALDQWAYNNHIELDFSRPGKPTDNAFIEAFKRKRSQRVAEYVMV